MSDQGQPTAAPSAAPAAPAKDTTDALADDVLAFLSEDQKPGKPRPRDEPAPAPTDEPDEDDAPPPAAQDEDEEEAAAEAPDEGEEAAPTIGTKDNPFTVKDLPKHLFIELKIDGEKVKVPLDELAGGYVREQTFHRRLNQTKQLSDRAEQLAKRAGETEEKLRTELRTFLRDPEELYEYFLADDERERVLESVAMKYAEMRRRHREKPEERLAWQRERDQRRLQAEREAWEAQRAQAEKERAQKEANERALAIFKPGWEEGLRKAGFPKPTQELYDEVMVRIQQRITATGQVTSEEIAGFVERAARLLELPPATAQKPKAPKAPAPKRERVNGKRDPFADLPPHKRRNSVDYFTRSLTPRDWR